MEASTSKKERLALGDIHQTKKALSSSAADWMLLNEAPPGAVGDGTNPPVRVPVAARYGHSVVEHTNALDFQLVFFGGSDADGQYLNELLIYDLQEMRFLDPIQVDEHSKGGVGGRNFHSAVVHGKRMYVFGGKANGYRNDLYTFSFRSHKWRAVKATGEIPSARFGHTAVVYNDGMYVFGGYDSDGYTCNDMYRFDFDSKEWSKLKPKSDTVPPARFHHTAVVYNGAMVVYGGKTDNANGDSNVHFFDFATSIWKSIAPAGNSPSPRYGHVSVLVQNELMPSLIIHGGRDTQKDYNDMWSLRLDLNTWSRFDAAGDKESASKKLSKAPKPQPRFFHSAILNTGKIWLFAGRDLQNAAFADFYRQPVKFGFLDALHSDILKVIMQYLNIKSLCRMQQVSNLFYDLGNQPELWSYLNKFEVKTALQQASPYNDGRTRVLLPGEFISSIPTLKPDNTNGKKFKVRVSLSRAPIVHQPRGGTLYMNVKCVLVGCGAAGKTCTCISFTTGAFPMEYIPTVFDNYSCSLKWRGLGISLSLWDVSGGGEDYDRLRPLSYPQTDVFIMVMSLISPNGFTNVTQKWIPEIRHHVPNCKVVLGGSKADLRDDTKINEMLKERYGRGPITDEEAEKLAKDINAYAYVPYSSLTQYNLAKLFDTALEASVGSSADHHTAMAQRQKGACVLQ